MHHKIFAAKIAQQQQKQENRKMSGFVTGPIGAYFHKRNLRRWEKAAELAEDVNLDALKDLRQKARAVAQRVNTITHIAEMRLTKPAIGSNAMKLPPSTDVARRAEVWSGPISPVGRAPALNNAKIGAELVMFHDCKNAAVSARQVRNHRPEHLAAFGLQIDVFDFDGSFLSLVLRASDDLVKNLTKSHILRLTLRAESERDLEMSARLNLKNGPNTEQVDKPFSINGETIVLEFDMAYVPFKEGKAEHIWFDFFFQNPMMNQVVFRDLILSRHKRAEL